MDYESTCVGPVPSVKVERKTLMEIMVELVSISDVSGAALVKADGSVVSWHANDAIDPTPYIDSVFDFISDAHKKSTPDYRHGMFTQKILDNNGHKVLISRITREVMLVLLLDRKAYLGLTMLDMEGYLREIDKVLK